MELKKINLFLEEVNKLKGLKESDLLKKEIKMIIDKIEKINLSKEKFYAQRFLLLKNISNTDLNEMSNLALDIENLISKIFIFLNRTLKKQIFDFFEDKKAIKINIKLEKIRKNTIDLISNEIVNNNSVFRPFMIIQNKSSEKQIGFFIEKQRNKNDYIETEVNRTVHKQFKGYETGFSYNFLLGNIIHVFVKSISFVFFELKKLKYSNNKCEKPIGIDLENLGKIKIENVFFENELKNKKYLMSNNKILEIKSNIHVFKGFSFSIKREGYKELSIPYMKNNKIKTFEFTLKKIY